MCTPLVRFAPYFTFCWGWKTITADWNKSKCKSFSLSLLWWHQSYSWFVEKLFQNCSNFCLPEIIVRLSSWYLFRPFRACVKRGRNFYHVWRKKSCYQYVFDDFPRVCTVRRRERKLPWRYMKYVFCYSPPRRPFALELSEVNYQRRIREIRGLLLSLLIVLRWWPCVYRT